MSFLSHTQRWPMVTLNKLKVLLWHRACLIGTDGLRTAFPAAAPPLPHSPPAIPATSLTCLLDTETHSISKLEVLHCFLLSPAWPFSFPRLTILLRPVLLGLPRDTSSTKVVVALSLTLLPASVYKPIVYYQLIGWSVCPFMSL